MSTIDFLQSSVKCVWQVRYNLISNQNQFRFLCQQESKTYKVSVFFFFWVYYLVVAAFATSPSRVGSAAAASGSLPSSGGASPPLPIQELTWFVKPENIFRPLNGYGGARGTCTLGVYNELAAAAARVRRRYSRAHYVYRDTKRTKWFSLGLLCSGAA